jgi:hypothetical protein
MTWAGISQYVYYKTGYPKLYSPAPISELLCRTNIGGDIRLGDLRFPYDVFCVLLEKNFEIEPGVSLKAVKITNLKSKFAKTCMSELVHEAVALRYAGLNILSDALQQEFEKVSSKVMLEFEIGNDSKVLQCSMKLSDSITNFLDHVEPQQEITAKITAKLVNFAAALLLRNHCRPETIVPFKLPRSERYQHKGNRESFRILTYPWKKSIKEGPTEEQKQAMENLEKSDLEKRKVKAHVRGFVYRTLRDERFKRNPDGTLRIIEVEPCLIHPEDFNLTE